MNIGLLHAPGFPVLDTAMDQPEAVWSLLQDLGHGVRALDETLCGIDKVELFVTTHGSCFPYRAWPRFHAYLESGGNWLHLGGRPMTVPVQYGEDGWKRGQPTSAWTRKLFIHGFAEVGITEVAESVSGPSDPVLAGVAGSLPALKTWSLDVRTPGTHASEGEREVEFAALIWGLGEGGEPVSAPAVVFDHHGPVFAGGRWTMIPADLPEGWAATDWGKRLMDRTVRYTTRGALFWQMRPTLATYRPGEEPVVETNLDVPSVGDAQYRIEIRVTSGTEELTRHDLRIDSTPGLHHLRVPVGVDLHDDFSGFCKVTGRLWQDQEILREKATGFWVHDGISWPVRAAVSVKGETLWRKSRALPVTGARYQLGPSLSEMNPVVWDLDFARMKDHGINMIRTNLGSAWDETLPDQAGVREPVLRMVDALCLSTAHYDIPVQFDIFAHQPPAWGDKHPFLDQRAIDSQKHLIQMLGERYKGASHLIWNLIHAPVFPTFETGERAEVETLAWRRWLEQRYASPFEVAQAWGVGESWDRFNDIPLHVAPSQREGQVVIDYKSFVREALDDWVHELTGALRASGPNDVSTQPVICSQDAGELVVPTDDIDVTVTHGAIRTESLLWDTVVHKMTGRPLLTQAGIGDEQFGRDQGLALQERKFAYAFAGGGFGLLWESWQSGSPSMGLLRADGTRSCELVQYQQLSRFISQAMPVMTWRQPEPVAVVVPQPEVAETWSSLATKRLVDLFGYELHVPLRVVYAPHLGHLRERLPKLIIVPSVRTVQARTWTDLLDLARLGATVLVTGASNSWSSLGVEMVRRNLRRDEIVSIEDREYRLSFSDRVTRGFQQLTFGTGAESALHEVDLGAGRLIGISYPVELAVHDGGASAALYGKVLGDVGLDNAGYVPPGVFWQPLEYRWGTLHLFISERGTKASGWIRDRSGFRVRFFLPAGRACMLAIDGDGRPLGVHGTVKVEFPE